MRALRIFIALTVLAGSLAAGAAPAAASGSPHQPRTHPLLLPHPAAVAHAKQRARFGAVLSNPMESFATGGRGQNAVVAGSLNQPGLAATDNASRNEGSPPDPTGAVGPDHYVEFVNSKVAVYTKSTLAIVASLDLDTFVGAMNDNVFDPQIQWDPVANRWFYLADDCTDSVCGGSNFLAYGFSKTANPTDLGGGWCNYSIETDTAGGLGLFDDYPKLGHNDSHLIFGTNVFDASGVFVSSRIWTVPKPAAGVTSCPAQPGPTPHYWSGPASAPVEDSPLLIGDQLENEDGSQSFTPVPADTTDSSANGYVVAAHDPSASGKIMAWHVDASGALVADGDIGVSGFSYPANVPQPGTTNTLDSLEAQLTQAVAHGDPDANGAEAVWTQHTINGPGGRSIDRWYELLPAVTTARQEGNVSDPTNYVFNGAISPTMSGNEAAIQYNVGGSGQLPQLWASSRTNRQPAGAMGSAVKLGDSVHFDEDGSCGTNPQDLSVCRWGDYAGATPDPAAATGQPDGPEHRVWGTNQLLGALRTPDPSFPNWTTRNFAVIAEHAPPIAAFSASPSTATRGQAVTFTGTQSRDAEVASGGIASYAWDFDGDGTTDQTSTSPIVTNTYSALGTFNARLVVTDSDDGFTSQPASQTVTVQNAPPFARLAFSPSLPVTGRPVTFSGATSSDPDGSIADFKWDLDGNGSFETDTGASPTVKKTYAKPGVVMVGLQVVDSDGATGQTTSSALLSPPPLKLVLKFPRKVRLKSFLARGLPGSVSCGRACVVALKVRLPAKVARKLKTKVTIVSAAIRIRGSGFKKVKLRPRRPVRTALARAKTMAVTVTGKGIDTAVHTSRAKLTVRVKR
ncbi:MAG: PKD domain-containing protein [Thermoleophilaceae bacterium]